MPVREPSSTSARVPDLGGPRRRPEHPPARLHHDAMAVIARHGTPRPPLRAASAPGGTPSPGSDDNAPATTPTQPADAELRRDCGFTGGRRDPRSGGTCDRFSAIRGGSGAAPVRAQEPAPAVAVISSAPPAGASGSRSCGSTAATGSQPVASRSELHAEASRLVRHGSPNPASRRLTEGCGSELPGSATTRSRRETLTARVASPATRLRRLANRRSTTGRSR